MSRIKLNAAGKQYFDLTYGTPWVFNKKYTYSTTTAILLQAVAAGFATVDVQHGTYGKTHFFYANNGQLIRKQYTDYTQGFDTWNPCVLPDGICDLNREGVHITTLDDIDAIALFHSLPSLY